MVRKLIAVDCDKNKGGEALVWPIRPRLGDRDSDSPTTLSDQARLAD